MTATARVVARLLPRSLLVAGGVAALLVACRASIRQDYRAYTRQWARILSGADPWLTENGELTGNAYGPVHNLLAWPYGLHPVLPRVIFTCVYLAIFAWFWRRFGTSPERRRSLAVVFAANGLFWISIADYGHNDILCAALALAAVVAVESRRPSTAGAMLALGVLTKLYPAVLAPLILFDERKPRWRFLTGFAALLAAGAGLAWWAWGGSLLAPVLYAGERGSSLLSIFYYLRASRSPLRWLGLGEGVDSLSGPLVLVALALVFVFHVRERLTAAFSSSLAFCVLFAFYKVGHFQFYIAPFLLLSYWYYSEAWPAGAQRGPLWPALVAYFVWFSAMPLAFRQLGHFKGEWLAVREWIGLPSFLIQAWLIGSLVRWQVGRRRAPRLTSEPAGPKNLPPSLIVRG